MPLKFKLIGFSPVTIKRRSAGSYVDGGWVEGTTSDILVQMKVQPAKPLELMQFPESERSREWLKVYCDTNLRTQVEGANGFDADEFEWESVVDGVLYTFKIMKMYRFKDSVIDHWKGWAARMELSAG